MTVLKIMGKIGRMSKRRMIMAALVLLLGIGGVIAAVTSSTPKLIFEGMKLKNVGGSIQARIDVNLCSVEMTGAGFTMEYDPDIVVPSDFDTNAELAESTQPSHSGGVDTWRFMRPNRDIFPLHDAAQTPAPAANPLMEGSVMGKTYMTAEGKKAVKVNFLLNNKYVPQAAETWLLQKDLKSSPAAQSVTRLVLDASRAEGTKLATLSFKVKDPAAFVKLTPEQLKDVFKLSVNKNGVVDGSISYVDTATYPIIQQYKGADFIDYEFALKATIERVSVDIAGNADRIKVSAADIYDKGTEEDLLTYLNAHARDVTVHYIGGAKIADTIVWGAPGSGYSAHNSGQPGAPLSWDPKGGTYEVSQVYKKGADGEDVVVKTTIEVTPVNIIGYNVENEYVAYAASNLPSGLADPAMRFPERAIPIFDNFLPSIGSYTLDVKPGTWAQVSPASQLSDFFNPDPAYTGKIYKFAAQLDDAPIPAWATYDPHSAAAVVTREIGEPSDFPSGFDAKRDISAYVDDDGNLIVELTLSREDPATAVAAGTDIRLRMPDGEIVEANKVMLDPAEPASDANGIYEVALNKDAAGGAADGKIAIKVKPPVNPAGNNKAYQFRLMQHINLGSRLGEWGIAIKDPGKAYGDEEHFAFEPRRNSYTGTEFTFDYSGVRAPLFKYELGTVLPARVRLAGGDHVMTVYDGISGLEPGQLTEVEADGAGWVLESIIKPDGTSGAPAAGSFEAAVGDTLVFKGVLADATYPGWGTVKNVRNPKDAVTLKLTASEPAAQGEKEEIDSVYDFVFDTQKVGYGSDKLQTRVFTVKNIGNKEIHGGSISVSGLGGAGIAAGEAPFEVVQRLPNIIRPGETAAFAIKTQIGATTGVHEARISIASNSGTELGNFKISFKVTDKNVYRVTININDRDYGSARTGGAMPPAVTPHASYTYEEGDTVMLTAEAAVGGAFDKWVLIEPAPAGGPTDIIFAPDEKTESVTFTMPAANVVVRADFDQSLFAKMGLENLRILSKNGVAKQLKTKNPLSGAYENVSFDTNVAEYYVILPYDVSEIKGELKLKNTEIEVDGVVKNVDVKVLHKADPTPTEVGITPQGAGEIVTDLVSVADPPTEDYIEIKITLPDGAGAGNPLVRTYKVILKRTVSEGQMADFEYGNSPFGLIMRDAAIAENEKQEFKSKFEELGYRFIKTEMPGGRLPARAIDSLWYNPRAWTAPGASGIASGGRNCDMDDYALFVYAGESFKLPGVRGFKQTDGTPVTDASLISVSLKVMAMPQLADPMTFTYTDFARATETDVPLAAPAGIPVAKQVCDGIKNMRTLPGVYKVIYSYPDYDGGTATVSRPLIVLAPRGDVNVSLGIVQSGGASIPPVNAADTGFIKSRFTAGLPVMNGSGYSFANLYRYRICDINGDGHLNDADAYTLSRILGAGGSLPVRFYPETVQ